MTAPAALAGTVPVTSVNWQAPARAGPTRSKTQDLDLLSVEQLVRFSVFPFFCCSIGAAIGALVY